MSSAGQELVAGRLPGERIATGTKQTSDSASITTTETEIASVTASLVSGRTYGISVMVRVGSSVAGDTAIIRLREDTIAGTEVGGDNLHIPTSSSVGHPYLLYYEYVAVSTAAKTFIIGLVRNAGTGNIRREAASTRPTFAFVDYISG
jgi:hypothetical protein